MEIELRSTQGVNNYINGLKLESTRFWFYFSLHVFVGCDVGETSFFVKLSVIILLFVSILFILFF